MAVVSKTDLMKVLLVSLPAMGLLNPLLGIGECLLRTGHEVVGLSGNAVRSRIESIGAGQTEDKADVNARVAWSGVGLDLKTNAPTPQALRDAVRTVVDTRSYRARASLMAKAFAQIDTRAEILQIVRALSRNSADSLLHSAMMAAK